MVRYVKLLEKFPEISFQNVLSDQDLITESYVKMLEKYMCGMYRAISTTQVDKLRLDVLLRKYKTTFGDI